MSKHYNDEDIGAAQAFSKTYLQSEIKYVFALEPVSDLRTFNLMKTPGVDACVFGISQIYDLNKFRLSKNSSESADQKALHARVNQLPQHPDRKDRLVVGDPCARDAIKV